MHTIVFVYYITTCMLVKVTLMTKLNIHHTCLHLSPDTPQGYM